MRKSKYNLFFLLTAPVIVLVGCSGNNSPAAPGQPTTIYAIATPTYTHSFLTDWGSPGTGPGQMNVPFGVWVDGLGNVYVADTFNNRISKFTPQGVNRGVYGGPASGTGPGRFYGPTGLVTDPWDNLWVADSGNSRLQELPAGLDGTSTANWVTIGSVGSLPGQFKDPFGVAFDGAGNMWVSDYTNQRVQELPAGLSPVVSGNWLTIGGTSPGTNPGQFNYLKGIAADEAGNIWVADTNNHRVQWLPAGKTAAVAGNWLTIGGPVTGNGPGQFNYPQAVAVDGTGNVYVLDSGNFRFQELPAGKPATVSSNWLAFGWTAGSEPWEFQGPQGIAADRFGNIYIADTTNNRIQVLGP